MSQFIHCLPSTKPHPPVRPIEGAYGSQPWSSAYVIGPLEQLAVLHTNAPEDAAQMAEDFLSQASHTPLIRNVTTVIGTHVGVNALGFAAVRAK